MVPSRMPEDVRIVPPEFVSRSASGDGAAAGPAEVGSSATIDAGVVVVFCVMPQTYSPGARLLARYMPRSSVYVAACDAYRFWPPAMTRCRHSTPAPTTGSPRSSRTVPAIDPSRHKPDRDATFLFTVSERERLRRSQRPELTVTSQ